VNGAEVWRAPLLILIVFALAGCGLGQECLTVSGVWERAESLDGQRIRVCGQADFALFPYHPLQIGGCIPSSEGESRSRIVGKLFLLAQDSEDSKRKLLISESSLQCEGDVCEVVCKPFAPSAHAAWGSTDPIEAFEFVGTLRILDQSEAPLSLEDIDLRASRRLVDGEWGPIPLGEFTYNFP
jgi:hypothetical protein